ncbi:MAG: ATP-dependent 6-phosphofructokinase [Bacteroidota bacterium]
MKKILVLTGGGDCPGLNAVIRAIVRSAEKSGEYEVWGSIEAFNGIMRDPPELIKLNFENTAGIHVKGGTIIKTTNRGNPFSYPVQNENGKWEKVDRSDYLIKSIREKGFDIVINIGGDGSQKISSMLHDKGVNIIGVPKTIDNDLSATDLTFGFNTAVQIATESFDKLVTTAASHNRVLIMEVMGRDAGWIALHTAIAGGAEICLIPEIPYRITSVVDKVKARYNSERNFVNIVIAEGAKAKDGQNSGQLSKDAGDPHFKYGGIGSVLRAQIEQEYPEAQVRTTVLGHIQRGGTPVAFDRILATAMGVKAFKMAEHGDFGKMVSFKNNRMEIVPLKDAIAKYNHIAMDNYLIETARETGITFGD